MACPTSITVSNTGATQYATLQDAIDAAAPGATITVGPGLVCVDPTRAIIIAVQGLSLIGANVGIDGAAPRGPESIIEFGCTGTDCPNPSVACGANGIIISADSVTIDGFTIQNNLCGPAITALGGVGVPVSGTTITNNIVQGNDFGIYINSASPSPLLTTVSNNLVQNNNAFTPFWPAIYSDQGLNNAVIANNTITGNGLFGNAIALIGPNGGGSPGTTVSDITINGNIVNSSGGDQSGFNFVDASNLNIFDNVLDGIVGPGVTFGSAVVGVTFSNNCVTSSTGEGILVFISPDTLAPIPNAQLNLSSGNSILCNGTTDPTGPPLVALRVDEGAIVPGDTVNFTGNYLGPNLGMPPDNVIVDPSGVVDSSGTLATPARVCPATACDPTPPVPPAPTPPAATDFKVAFLPDICVCTKSCKGTTVDYSSPFLGHTGLGYVFTYPSSGSVFPIGTTTVTGISFVTRTVFRFNVTVSRCGRSSSGAHKKKKKQK